VKQQQSIVFAARPRRAEGVPDTPQAQESAFLDLVDKIVQKTDADIERVPNEDWTVAFGIYWHLKALMGLYAWRQHWALVKAHIDAHRDREGWDHANERLELWAWFAAAMNWRRQQSQAAQERAKAPQRWQQIKANPQRHAARKAENRLAQQQRRSRMAHLEESPCEPWEPEEEAAQ